MSDHAQDRRTAKTIAALRSALIELMMEKHYDSITVQDIIDGANVGRSTFYSHFRDKEDLLVGDWKRFFQMIADFTNILAADAQPIAPIQPVLSHLRDMQALYRALVRSGKTDRLFSVGIDYLAQKLEEKIRQTTDVSSLGVRPEFFAHLLSLQIFGTLKWWLDRDMPHTPAEMSQMFESLVAPGVRAVIGRRVSDGRSVS
jgi:AcrR family transcriptional regulator